MCGIDDMSSQGSWYMECTWGQKHYTICYTIYTIYNNKNSVVTWYSPPDLPPGVSSWGWSVVSLVVADSPWERDCYTIYTIYNNKTVVAWYSPPDLPRGVSGRHADHRSAPAVDSPREIWWTISHNYTVLFISCDVKNTKFNQYSHVDLMSLNVSNSRFWKPVMFWKWRRHGIAFWHQDHCAWHKFLPLMTASNVNCWADVANQVTQLWRVGDTENFKSWITG